MTALPPSVRDLIATGPLAYLTTTRADGSPHVTGLWIGLDDEALFTVHARENAKLRNLRRDPRVAITFAPPQVPGDWLSPHVVIEARGTVEQRPDAWSLMNALAKVYVGPDADLPGGGEPGFVVRYEVDRVRGIGPWAG